MMTIEEIIVEKPHLRETLRLYEKVMEFSSAAARLMNGTACGETTYPPELTGPVFEVFSSIFEMPEESLAPVKEAMKGGRIDLTRLPLNELPSFSLPYHEDELGMILFLVSRPLFFHRKECLRGANESWEGGKCPTCHGKPSLASLEEDGKRRLHCSYCGGSGHFRRLGCPLCLSGSTSTLTLFAEGEPGYRIDVCDACGSYVKTATRALSDDPADADLADLISLPLDLIAQGRGYRRHSPNPLGMMRMS